MTRLLRPPLSPSARRRFAALCLIYILVMLYASTVVGPAGTNFVFRDPAAAFQQFLGIRFVAHGSDQRADWIGNLLMLIPFGFLAAGTIWPRRPAFRLPAAFAALVFCSFAILAIKYLQLYFPPRTVTLNYIVAQLAGATIGCASFAIWQRRIGAWPRGPDAMSALVVMLRLYCAALLIFVLMPLDFALNTTDFWTQIDRLQDTVLALPGEDRPLPIRIVLIAASSAAFAPVGMLLVLVRRGARRVRRELLAVTAMGLAIATGIFILSALVIGAAPSMGSILYRTAGVVAGAASLRWLIRQDAARLRGLLRRLVPWLVPLYLFVLLLVNRLLSLHWLSVPEAVAQAYPLGFIPLFDYYIVSKAAAAKNIVAHALIYMPIGAALWLRDGRQRVGLAFFLAAALSFAVELARYFRPGLEGDINAVLIAGLAAMGAMRLAPWVWSMLETLTTQSAAAPVRTWNGRDHLAHPLEPSFRPHGEIEHF